VRRPLLQSLVAWLSLICFGLGSTLLHGDVVLCRHADGTSQIEWGPCAPDDSGDCRTGCGDSFSCESEAPEPCKDIPVKDARHVAHAAVSQPVQPTWLPAPAVAILTPDLNAGPVLARYTSPSPRARPPDNLARLRTIVLLV
jgi:hypothetical protein